MTPCVMRRRLVFEPLIEIGRAHFDECPHVCSGQTAQLRAHSSYLPGFSSREVQWNHQGRHDVLLDA